MCLLLADEVWLGFESLTCVKVLHLNVRLVQDSKGEYLKRIKRGVFEVFKDDLKWQN